MKTREEWTDNIKHFLWSFWHDRLSHEYARELAKGYFLEVEQIEEEEDRDRRADQHDAIYERVKGQRENEALRELEQAERIDTYEQAMREKDDG